MGKKGNLEHFYLKSNLYRQMFETGIVFEYIRFSAKSWFELTWSGVWCP